jgi:ribosomal protein S18 acetylase RimI-like enzyme
MNPCLELSRFTTDPVFEQQYLEVFPEVSVARMNGVFGRKAIWYRLTMSKQMVGFCTVGLIGETQAFIYNVGILPQYRHQGYGTQMVRLLIDLLRTRDLYLFVRTINHYAIQLYRSCQFEVTTKDFVPPEGHVCMHKSWVPSRPPPMFRT